MIEAYNTAETAVTAGQQAPLTAYSLHCDKKNVSLNGNTLTINEPGTYLVSADFVFAPTATTAEVQMLVNGVAVPEATRQITATAAANTMLHTQHVISVPCCCPANANTIAFVYPEAGTQSAADVIVQRVS